MDSIYYAVPCLYSFQNSATPIIDEAGVKKNTTDYEEAFNERNSEKLASLWVVDALYVNLSTHDTLQGRDQIAAYFKKQFEYSEGENLKIIIDDIKIDASGKATEKGTAVITSQDKLEKSHFIAELTKANGAWLLRKVYEVEAQVPPSHFEQLKELEWLTGKWESKNDLIDFSLNVNWDENKNFLIQKFTLLLLDQKNLSGQQIIGWDPAAKRIRSWIIDSDGGFGEGFWTRQGNRWYISMVFTLPDGRKASSTHIYTKVDDNTFTFATEDRNVGDRMLPNIKPFQINKVE